MSTTLIANSMPQEPGYYWAKWQKATDDTPDRENCTPIDEWEIVEVGEEHPYVPLYVLVPGVTTAQLLECFTWGAKVAELNAGPGQ